MQGADLGEAGRIDYWSCGVDFGHAKKSGLLAWDLRSRADPKVDKKRGNVSFLSTGLSEIGERGSESRTKSQKIEKMFYRRLQIQGARLRK